MNVAMTKSQARGQRALNASMYQPKAPRAQAVARQPVVDMRLRKLTSRVLDELKRPDAIPSNVIYAALVEAGANK